MGTEFTAAPVLSVVIPAYNEARRLPQSLRTVLAYLSKLPYPSEVLVVDDGSRDQTATLAEQIATEAGAGRVRVLRLDHRGKAYAVRAGVLAASGDYILFCDADLATPIEELQKLKRFLDDGYDLAIASREGLGARREGEPYYRHVMGRVFNLLIQLVAVRGIHDTQCGFKAFHRAVAHDLFSRLRLYAENARVLKTAAVTAFDVELLFLARRRGYRIREVPTEWHYGTETKVDPLRDSWRNLLDLLRVRWNDWRGVYSDVQPVVRSYDKVPR